MSEVCGEILFRAHGLKGHMGGSMRSKVCADVLSSVHGAGQQRRWLCVSEHLWFSVGRSLGDKERAPHTKSLMTRHAHDTGLMEHSSTGGSHRKD